VPGMTLQSDIDNHHQRKVNIGEGTPNSPYRQLQDYGKGENGRNLKLGHCQKVISDEL